MVSFSCENCADVLTKKKLDLHRSRCRGATFTCIDCMVHFSGTDYKSHTSCVTEEQKYHGALYKNKKQKTTPNTRNIIAPAPAPFALHAMAQHAYVEEVPDELDWRRFQVAGDDVDDVDDDDDDGVSSLNSLVEAPTPPPCEEEHVNVFDFLVANSTPGASVLNLPEAEVEAEAAATSEEAQLVRFDFETNGLVTPFNSRDDALADYADHRAVSAGNLETPAPRGQRTKGKGVVTKQAKTGEKKRKRLHVETDRVMTDAPALLHSGLTGGINRLMTRPEVFPPSPDNSGSDGGEAPVSPMKKTKHGKTHKPARASGSFGNSLMALVSGATTSTKDKEKSKTKSSKTKTTTQPTATATTSKTKTTKTSAPKRKPSTSAGSAAKKPKKHRVEAPAAAKAPPTAEGEEPKLLEFRPNSKDGSKDKDKQLVRRSDEDGQMILFQPQAEQFLSFITKGPESERGYSMNKALKRFHRERSAISGSTLPKAEEEKELWRSLRLKKNDRGEIVLFCV